MSTLTMPDLPAYPIPLDGAPHVITLPPAYEAHGLIVVNAGSVALTVTNARGETWTVAPGGRLQAPLTVAVPNYTFASARADPAGAQAAATFTQELITVLSETSTATSTLSDLVLLPTVNPPGTIFMQTVPITPDILSCTLVLATIGANITDASLQGADSHIIYWRYAAATGNIGQWNIPVYGGVDTGLDLFVSYVSAGPTNAITLFGHRFGLTGNYSLAGALQVTLAGAQPALSVSGIVAAAPTQSANGTQVAPAAFTSICTLTIAAAGVYRVIATMYSDDTAAAGRRFVLFGGGSNLAMAGVSQGVQTVVLDGLQLAAGAVVLVQNAAAGSAGSVYFAALYFYRIA